MITMPKFCRRAVCHALVLLFIFVFCPCFSLDFQSQLAPDELARSILDAMSDEEALAQTFMLGWVGAEPSPIIMDWIRNRQIGGIKIFGWNTDDTLKLAETVGALQTGALAGRFKIPLFVATDQEGGWIRHVKGATSETPGNMAISASGFPLDAYYSGYYIGRELAVLGINMNFAPTVDLYTNRDSTLIGPRSFGIDPAQAGLLGAAFAKGQLDAGVIATAKHFPGHGDTDLDSHGVLPEIHITFDVLWNRELIPYRLLSRERIPAIMSGHLAFPKTTAASTPASLSSWFLKDILRDRIGFTGLVITDDLLMNGATMYGGSVSRVAKEAIIAGNDIIMLSKTPNMYDPVWAFLVSSMKDDETFRARVREAAYRVLKTKAEYLRGKKAVPLVPDIDRVRRELPDRQGSAFFLDLAARSVTLIRGKDSGDGSVFPLTRDRAGRVLLAGRYGDFFEAGRAAFPDAASYRFYVSQGTGELQRLARDADTVIFCLSEAGELPLLESLRSMGKRVIVFSVLSPVYLDKAQWVDGAIAVYSYARESFIAGFSAILGRIPLKGRLPFPLDEPRWKAPQS